MVRNERLYELLDTGGALMAGWLDEIWTARLGGRTGRSTERKGTLARFFLPTGLIERVRFSFWKLACKQGLPVGIGCWDMSQNWI